MIIGIDIDNTLTNVQEELNEAAYNYAIKLGKGIDSSVISEDINNNGSFYKEKFKFSYDELKYFLKEIMEEIINRAEPRVGVIETIRKLREEGHKIYIITARDSEFHDDPYYLSKNWLDKNKIEYDKLIVNARKKAPVCIQENVDLFIDDQLNNCIEITKEGIQTIRISCDKNNSENIATVDNWKQIYEYIKNNKVIKIVKYNDTYKQEICTFINECMHIFINRPYKDRPDISDINNYYIKCKGNFWLAIDVESKNIVGSIALENRNEYGILKRFYVDSNYQRLGIGKRLYEIFESYVRNQTSISKIYLACGNILKEAHNFYIKNGFVQISNLDIDMHYAEDDDFFIKNIKIVE